MNFQESNVTYPLEKTFIRSQGVNMQSLLSSHKLQKKYPKAVHIAHFRDGPWYSYPKYWHTWWILYYIHLFNSISSQKKKKKSTLKWNAIKRNWFTLDLGKHWHWTCEMDLLLQSFQVVLTPLHLKPWQCSSNQPRHLLFWSYCAPREVLGHVSGTNLH